jgi:hypothetical protein
LIYCAAWGRRFASIAVKAGFAYGVCAGQTPRAPVAFLDLDYRHPDTRALLAWAWRYRPWMAIAGDAENIEQLDRVLDIADVLSTIATEVVVVPKQPGLVTRIPEEYVVGLSVPTRFGGTGAPYWEYEGRRLHLLGGAPQRQMELYRYFGAAILSADGNAHQRAAQRGVIWQAGGWVSREAAVALEPPGPDLPYRCFARSCANIMEAWRTL